MTERGQLAVVSTEDSAYFAESIMKSLNSLGVQSELIEVQRRKFKNGEPDLKLNIPSLDHLKGRDILIVGSTHTDPALLEIMRLGIGLATTYQTRRRIFAIPFFGCSTMERVKEAGEIATGLASGEMLASLPGGEANVFLFLDLHSEKLLAPFNGRTQNLTITPLLLSLIKGQILQQNPGKRLTIVAADKSRFIQAQTFAKDLGVGAAYVDKIRHHDQVKARELVGEVAGTYAVIVDDMARSVDGTAVKAYQQVMKSGALGGWVVLNHFAVDHPCTAHSLLTLKIFGILTSNSHPEAEGHSFKHSPKSTILDAGPVYAQRIAELVI